MAESRRCGVTILTDLRSTYERLESNSVLVWLDPHVNTRLENREAQNELEEIIHPLKTFEDQQSCYQYICSSSRQSRITLIVNGQCGEQLVPQIHHLQRIIDIYVYCLDKPRNERWAKGFPKV